MAFRIVSLLLLLALLLPGCRRSYLVKRSEWAARMTTARTTPIQAMRRDGKRIALSVEGLRRTTRATTLDAEHVQIAVPHAGAGLWAPGVAGVFVGAIVLGTHFAEDGGNNYFPVGAVMGSLLLAGGASVMGIAGGIGSAELPFEHADLDPGIRPLGAAERRLLQPRRRSFDHFRRPTRVGPKVNSAPLATAIPPPIARASASEQRRSRVRTDEVVP